MQQIIDFVLSDLIMVITPIIFGKLTLENKLRKDKSKFVVAFLISCILYGLLYLYLDGAVKSLCMFGLHIFMFYNFYKIKFTNIILITFIFSFIIMLFDFIYLIVVTILFNVSKDFCYNVIAGTFFSNVIVCSLSLIFALILRKRLQKIFITEFSDTFLNFLLIFWFSCIIILFFSFALFYKKNDNFMIFLLPLVFSLLIVLYFMKTRIFINDKLKEYNELLKFLTNYENELEEKRIKGHEIKNQISTINSMLKDNANKHKLEKYVKELVGDYKDLDNVKYSDLQYLPSNGIKGFICSKISLAVSMNVDVEVLIEKEIVTSVINNLNDKDFKYLCIILGVFLDNAIEASIESIDKKIGIEIYLINGDVLIVITNSYTNKSNDKVNLLKSSKGKNRGHGLKLVRRVISQSNKFVLNSEANLDSFVQKLLINGNKKTEV